MSPNLTHPSLPLLDRQAVQQHFSRAAVGYDAASVLQREVAKRLLERLDYITISPTNILDLGCATGADLNALSERYSKSFVLGADANIDMLQAGRAARKNLRWLLPFLRAPKSAALCADAQALPLASGSMGLVWSNLMLHWLADPLAAFAEMHRVLEVGGLLMFCTLGPDTLKELRASFQDGHAHTQRFVDMHDYGDMLLECGFSDPVMDVDTLTMTYANFDDLALDLRRNGATCALQTRRRGLMGRATWQSAREHYERFRIENRLPASFELVFGHAWKNAPKNTIDNAKHASGEAGLAAHQSVIHFDPKARMR